MYPPPHYSDNSPAFMAGVMREHSFAVMTMVGNEGLISTHLPFVLKDEGKHGTLYAHTAKQNPLSCLMVGDNEAMVVFTGPHAYISASWYDNPDKRVPTWNYISVQAKGYPITLPKTDYMSEMTTLVKQSEKDGNWSIDRAQDYAKSLMNGITYFKIPIISLKGIRKMSANKSDAENKRIINHLRKAGEVGTASAMEAACRLKQEQ